MGCYTISVLLKVSNSPSEAAFRLITIKFPYMASPPCICHKALPLGFELLVPTTSDLFPLTLQTLIS